MALEVDFLETYLGIPMPNAYCKITGMFVNPVAGYVRLNVRFYVNSATRTEDVDIKRVITEKALLNAKDRRAGIQSTLDALLAKSIPQQTEIDTRNQEMSEVCQEILNLDSQYQNMTGLSPFLDTKFEFNLNQEMIGSFLAQGYAQLKQSQLDIRSNGSVMRADLTQARDV